MNTEKIYSALPTPSNYIFLLFWVPFLLYMSYLIANDYLIEVLSAISKKYEINSDMTGILLLNIGNGIPDLITSVVALNIDPYIALCISLGSFIFLMTVVLGGVVMFSRRNEKICYRTFYKNVVFTFIAFLFVLYILAMQKIDIKLCIGMLVTYIVFLIYSFYNSIYASDVIEEINVPQVNLHRKKIKYLFDRFSRPFKFFLDVMLLNASPKPNYTPILPKYILGFLSPMINFFLIFVFMNLKMNWGKFISVMAFSCLSGLILGFLINKSPENAIFPLYTFLFSCIWIFVVSNELISVINVMDQTLGINKNITALTLIAWANCIGDLVTGIVSSNNGMYRTAVNATMAAPVHNVLFNLGLIFTVLLARSEEMSLEFYIFKDISIVGLSFIPITLLVQIFNYEARNKKLCIEFSFVLLFLYVWFLSLTFINSATNF